MTRNIWAVGRNFVAHAKELDNLIPTSPLIFLKAGSCVTEESLVLLSSALGEVHFEVEMALRLDQDLKPSHYTVALDLTDRQAQTAAKKQGLPWTQAKSFKNSCPIGAWKEMHKSIYDLNIELRVNGVLKQKSALKNMIFSINTLVADIKRRFPVEPGDIILTGTPEGVGPVSSGDLLEARIGDEVEACWTIQFEEPA